MFGDPPLNIYRCDEQQYAKDIGDEDVGSSPPVGRSAAVSDGIHNQRDARHNGQESRPVHLDIRIRAAEVGRNGEAADDGDKEATKGAYPEEPSPPKDLGRHGANDDTEIEADAPERTIYTKDDVLSRSGSIRLSKQRQASGEKGS